MKKLLFVLFLVPFISNSQKIFSVEYQNQSDIKVYVVEYENQSDLKVFKVDYPWACWFPSGARGVAGAPRGQTPGPVVADW